MSNLKKVLLTLICLIFSTSNLLAENKVAYIDLDKILVNTEAGKSLFKQLNNLEKLKLENLKNEEKKLYMRHLNETNTKTEEISAEKIVLFKK